MSSGACMPVYHLCPADLCAHSSSNSAAEKARSDLADFWLQAVEFLTSYIAETGLGQCMAPRSARPGAGAYLPPHLRAGNAGITQQQRSLDELAPHNMIIKLEYTAEGPFSLHGCPDNIVEQPQQQKQEQQQQAEPTEGTTTANPQHQLACVHIESPANPDSYQMSELLGWFAQASKVQQLPDFPDGDSRAVLSLPASISKHERAKWHSAAQRAGLDSESKGIGAERFIQVSTRPHHHPASTDPAATRNTLSTADTHSPNRPLHNSSKGSDSSSWRRDFTIAVTPDTQLESGSPSQPQALDGNCKSSKASSTPGKPFKPRYKQVWEWCQLEGGAFWNYSQGEVREMLSKHGVLPPELQRVVHKRETSASLCEALQQKDESGALALLVAAPSGTRLSWVRDQESGGYPAHIAAFHGLGEFIQQLIACDGVEILQQHDARRNTPITLAQQQGHHQLAAELDQLRVQAYLKSAPAGSTAAAGDSRIGSRPEGLGAAIGPGSKRPPDHDSNSSDIVPAGVTLAHEECSRVADSRKSGEGSADTPEAARVDSCVQRYNSYTSNEDKAFVLFGRGRGANSRGQNSSGKGQGRTNSFSASTDNRNSLKSW